MLYLLVAKALIVDPAGGFGRGVRLPALLVALDMSPRYLLSWIDPVFVLYATDTVVLAPSAPALLTALVLGALVGVNGAVGIETLVRRPPACEGRRAWWSAAVLPSFLASFSCCAPTVLVLLGASAAGAVVSVIPFVVPTAAILLLASLIWSLRRLERTTAMDRGDPRPPRRRTSSAGADTAREPKHGRAVVEQLGRNAAAGGGTRRVRTHENC